MMVYVQASQQWAAKYIPPIVKRFNKLVPGVVFSPDDIHGALYACPYDLAAGNRSPWCNVFRAHELRGLE
jgi:acid phosphatase